MPPERSHAEASRLRARQSRIAKHPERPVHLLRPCKRPVSPFRRPREHALVSRARVVTTLAHARSRLPCATLQIPIGSGRGARRRHRQPHPVRPGRRPRRRRALAAHRRRRWRPRRVRARGPRPRRRHLAAVLALLRATRTRTAASSAPAATRATGSSSSTASTSDRLVEAVYAQHSGAERCGGSAVERRDGRPVVYAAHGSHASYLHAGTRDRLWPDPNDEADGRGRGHRRAGRRDHRDAPRRG